MLLVTCCAVFEAFRGVALRDFRAGLGTTSPNDTVSTRGQRQLQTKQGERLEPCCALASRDILGWMFKLAGPLLGQRGSEDLQGYANAFLGAF